MKTPDIDDATRKKLADEDCMRKIVVDEIEILRDRAGGFHEKDTMRWKRWWLNPFDGLCFFDGKKQQKKSVATDAIKLHETVRSDFETLDNMSLLTCYTMLVRQINKQM